MVFPDISSSSLELELCSFLLFPHLIKNSLWGATFLKVLGKVKFDSFMSALLIMPFIILQHFNEQNTDTEVSEALEIRVSDLITEDEVHIEACDNVTEPSDNKRSEILY